MQLIYRQVPTQRMAAKSTTTQTRGMLTPEERRAVISFSADILPKTRSTEVRKPHGMVKVSENGRMYAMNERMSSSGAS